MAHDNLNQIVPYSDIDHDVELTILDIDFILH